MNYFKSVVLVLMLVGFCGCSGKKEDVKISSDPSAVFQEGIQNVRSGDYTDAIAKFETVEREHPASTYATESMVRKAYAYYLNADYENTKLTVQDFVRQYPNNQYVPYMYYLKALSCYNQMVDIERDQQTTVDALEALDDVIIRFPNTQYSDDAKLKRDLVFNRLAAKEMQIALFYIKQRNNISALNRLKVIVDKYDTSVFIPEALYRMTVIYYSLGAVEQAERYAAVLGHNYPNSEWYTKSYNILKNKVQK
ncbi:outer membrane protein assembly factor BamD [Rickettsiales endosymbiont of Peranema trichophorum]|uniref:outer membrane protein assembly factor BamD n=1 Tax=Rickettsiales endosymbiont of Peranema trichophorum TaxID=2486577 RepID=UPI0010237675|nr:outer membrane protein assembly factor BamD [Rickettsiales endosymbiont of Peranema trichophorum]RZI47417.1 outer membrane protein assembly factor BamD [Rickettsiales endosymbiont of Peranema trichophorum]